MKNLLSEEIDRHRRRDKQVLDHFGSYGDESCGAFSVTYPGTGLTLLCIVASGDGWDHVSVSAGHRIPNWREMCFVKRLFFHPEETVMQLHPPESEYVDVCKTCLHLWRPTDQPIPIPPKEFVG